MKLKQLSKTAQAQMGETIGVIVVVIILLFIGIVFWNKVSVSNIVEVQSQDNELSVIEIANIVPELDELKCYESSVSKVKCLDLYKLLAMSNITQSGSTNTDAMLYYNSYFKNSRITVQIVYPKYLVEDPTNPGTFIPKDEYNITLYDAQIKDATVSKMITLPVNIKDYIGKKTYYGMIIVEGYYK